MDGGFPEKKLCVVLYDLFFIVCFRDKKNVINK